MVNKILRWLIAVFGMAIGLGVAISIVKFFPGTRVYSMVCIVSGGIIGGILMFAIFPIVMEKGKIIARRTENEIAKIPPMEILINSIGLIIGLFIAYLISQLFLQIPIPVVGVALSCVVYLFLGYIGITLSKRYREDFLGKMFTVKYQNSGKDKNAKKSNKATPKILDTSVIIDGRIADICNTGFIEGKIVIPSFVLEELRHIADSSDDLKRVRGRRGLDILNKIQKELDIEVEISERDFDDISEVDVKLLKLAQVIDGKVVTNDYNLNKVAQFQGVDVLNINELANAVKPVVIPGEEMIVQIIKEGKENGQGVAYLDDGTMIVVDGGRKYIGETIDVLVTSVLQTAAGRMIFGKPKLAAEKSI